MLDLKGKNVLVTGGSRGLGAEICQRFAKEGSNVAVNYNTREDKAREVVASAEKHGVKAILIKGDVGVLADCQRMVKEAADGLGGLDVIINNAGWTKPCKFGDLDAMNEEEWDKTWAVNTKSNLHLLRAALPIFNANQEGGSFLITSSIAGSFAGGSSMAYSVTKAAGLHLVTCLAETQGPKIRVNAIQPGFLKTDWGHGLPQASQEMAIKSAKLQQDTKLDDVVDAFVMLARNTSTTGAKIRIDAGLHIS